MSGSWGVPLVEVGLLDPAQLIVLQGAGLTTVDDVLAMAVADPTAILRLLGGGVDLPALETDLLAKTDMDAADFTGPRGFHSFGAAFSAPEFVDLVAPTEHLALAMGRMQLGPEFVPSEPDHGLSVNHCGCMRPVRNQLGRQTCVAFACAALLECAEYRRTNVAVDLAPQFVYWDCKHHDGMPQTPTTTIPTAMACLARDGACEEAAWPYGGQPVAGNEAQDPPPGSAMGGAASHKAQSVSTLPARSSADLITELDGGRPLALVVPVYATSPLVKVWTNPRGKITMPVGRTHWIGNHAVCVVGHQPDPTAPGGGFFIVRNSWGTDWAKASPYGAGYGALPLDYVDMYGGDAMSLT